MSFVDRFTPSLTSLFLCRASGLSAELEERLETQELRSHDHTVRSAPALPSHAAPLSENDQLVEFFLTELEKHQTVTTTLATAHAKLQQALHAHEQRMQRHESEQTLRLRKYLEVMSRVERAVVHGEKLRAEEKQLTTVQSQRRHEALKRAVEDQLAALQAQCDLERTRWEEHLERKFVDVVVENQTLKAETMELRGELQHVSAMARRCVCTGRQAGVASGPSGSFSLTPATHCTRNGGSNKKTIRSLTDEVLKLKSVAAVYPSELDELLAFRSPTLDRKGTGAVAGTHPLTPHSA